MLAWFVVCCPLSVVCCPFLFAHLQDDEDGGGEQDECCCRYPDEGALDGVLSFQLGVLAVEYLVLDLCVQLLQAKHHLGLVGRGSVEAVLLCCLDGLDVFCAAAHAQGVTCLLAVIVCQLLQTDGFVVESVALVDVAHLCVDAAFQVSGDVQAVFEQGFLEVEEGFLAVEQFGVDASYVVVGFGQAAAAGVLPIVLRDGENERVGGVLDVGFVVGFYAQELVVGLGGLGGFVHLLVKGGQQLSCTVGMGGCEAVYLNKKIIIPPPVGSAAGGQYDDDAER